MLPEALGYPLRGDRGDAAETLAVGGGLHLLAAFVPLLPLVAVLGYLVRVFREADDATGDPATFRSPGGVAGLRALVRDGLLGAVVVVAYTAVPVAVLLVTFYGLLDGAVPLAGGGRFVLLAGGTATLFVAVAFAYPLPAALAALARSGLRAALSPSTLRPAVTTGRYFYAWCVGAAVLGVGGALAPALNPFVVGFFLGFYLEVVAVAAWARGVGGKRFVGGC